MSVELKVGQVWEDRSGTKIAIVKNTTGRNEDSHPFMSFGRPWTYRSDGGFAFFSSMTHERDLIELVQDENGNIVEESPKASGPVAQEPPAILMLQAAADHMRDRAATYDKPDGERSMGKTVDAFNVVTGRDLSEAEGWLLLQILKDVRLFQRPGYHADSAEDCVAYAALKAEAKMAESQQ